MSRRALLLVLLLAAPVLGDVPKAKDDAISVVNRDDAFAALLAKVEPVVRELTAAKEDERGPIEDRLVAEFGRTGIEALVRFREPELIPVFVRLADHEDWYVRRLAILGLQRLAGLSGLDVVVRHLADETVLVREIAATTTAILHEIGSKYRDMIPRTSAERDAAKGLGKREKEDARALKAAHDAEENRYVKASLAMAIEVLGKRRPIRIHEEQTTGEPGARHVPRVVGAQVKAWQGGSGYQGAGSGRLKPTKGWAYPLLVYPKEILNIGSDRPLVPLEAKANSLHFGHDCGWFLEGSTVYAIADGVVRMIQSGDDWGGLIVVEYMDEDGEKVNGLNGHCGMWVFVKPGEAVVAGQPLGQMALSFSPENGGHGAHDHFGMFAGPFQAGMCYGRRGAGCSTDGWLVPPDYLTPKVEGKPIPPDSYR